MLFVPTDSQTLLTFYHANMHACVSSYMFLRCNTNKQVTIISSRYTCIYI